MCSVPSFYKQCRWLGLQGIRDTAKIHEREVVFAALDATHVAAIQLGIRSKNFLRHARLFSGFADGVPKETSSLLPANFGDGLAMTVMVFG